MKNLTFLFILFLILNSCKNSTYNLFFKSENAEGIYKKGEVTLNGIKIGKINEVNLSTTGNVFVKLQISNKIQLPDDSELTLKNMGFFDSEQLVIVPGKSNHILNNNDTIKIVEHHKSYTFDSLSSGFIDALNTISSKNKNDSILIELRRLNENLEKLQQEK